MTFFSTMTIFLFNAANIDCKLKTSSKLLLFTEQPYDSFNRIQTEACAAAESVWSDAFCAKNQKRDGVIMTRQ